VGGFLAGPDVDTGPGAASLDAAVEQFAVPAVSGGGLITGAGFVCAPGLLADAPWHLSWWLSVPPHGARRLPSAPDPSSEMFRDYTALEWWRVPLRTGTRHLTGPYVDYVCTVDYAVTITVPVYATRSRFRVVVDPAVNDSHGSAAGASMLGVVGVDALVDSLERELSPVLRECAAAHAATGPATAAVVNGSGRVVTATDARREPGSILRLDGLLDALAPLRDLDARGQAPVDVTTATGVRVLSCGDTSLALVIGY
jgi:hypothetical protein